MMTHDEAVAALATYALDAVDGEEREEIERHLAGCPRCRAELDAQREVTTALGNSVEPLPEGLWSSIASHLPARRDDEPPPMPRLIREGGPASAAPRSSPRNPARGRTATVGVGVVAVAAVVTVLAVLAVNLVHADNQVSQLRTSIGQKAPGDVVAALEAPGHQVVNLEGAGHRTVAQFVVVPDGRGYLVSSTLPALPASHTYQLWGVVKGTPISLGLLGQKPDQATFTLAGAAPASRLAITVEPAGGSVRPARAMVAQGVVS